jgi:hypothetical protein
MSPALLATLNEAIQAGTPLRVRYNDGARQTMHTVLPIVASTRLLRARDLVTRRWRIFLLRDLEIVMDDGGMPEMASVPAASPQTSIIEALPAVIDELRRLGWHVAATRDRLAVHLTHPDGKPIKIASALIVLRPGAVRRPWSVVAPGLRLARAFPTLAEATALFMTQMRLNAPELLGRRAQT